VDIFNPGQQAQNPRVIPVREQILGGYEYRGYAYAQLEALERDRLETGAPMLSDNLRPADGVEIYIRVSKYGHLIRITEGETGFICHPRDNTNPGGAKPGGVAITPTYQYPLVDDDHGSRVLTWNGKGWDVSSEVENYGNLDWMGEDGEAVSWRGPAGRQFAMDRLLSFPGFTEWDGADLEHDYYTPYRNLVYQGGEVIKEFLSGYKVLGAALAGGSLVTVVGVDYTGIPNPDGGTGGFYDEVYVGDTRIGWQSASRPTVPWFFDSTGRVAVCGNRKLTIAEDLASVTFDVLDAGGGTQTNAYTGSNDWGVTKTGSWPMFRDYAGTTLNELALTVAFDEGSVHTGDSDEDYDDLPIMYSGVPPNLLTVTGPDAATVGAEYDYVITGLEGFIPCDEYEVEWSFSGGTIANGAITDITGCGTATVTATVSGGGFTLSGSKRVRLPSGMWLTDGYEYGPDYSTGNSGIYTTVILGEYEYSYFQGADMNITVTRFTTDIPTSSEPSCPGCRSVTDGGTDYSRGPGEDYTYEGTIHYAGTTSCCPGARQGTSYDAYYKLYCISRRKWVCP